MAISRHDVLFYYSDRRRNKDILLNFVEICDARGASTVSALKEELQKKRPDVFVYGYAKGDDKILPQIKEVLDSAEYEYLPTVLVVSLSCQEKVVSYFNGERLIVQNDNTIGPGAVTRLSALLEEIDDLPQVLVFEDDEEHRTLVINHLEDWATPCVANSEEEAIELLNGNHVDVVMLGIDISGNAGGSFFDRIRMQERGKNIPVLFLAAKADKDTILRCVKKHAAGILTFPYSPELLKQHINDSIIKPRLDIKKKIVVCDDEVMMLKQIEKILEDEYSVVCINGGDEMIKYCAKFVPDLIILDYEMPDKNGVYVLKRLRMDERFNYCPIIMLTGNKDRETVVSCVSAGAQGYLVKPVKAMNLKLRVRQFLGTVD